MVKKEFKNDWVLELDLYAWNPFDKISFAKFINLIFNPQDESENQGLFIRIKFICIGLELNLYKENTLIV